MKLLTEAQREFPGAHRSPSVVQGSVTGPTRLDRLNMVADLRLVELANALGLSISLGLIRRCALTCLTLAIILVPTTAAGLAAVAGNNLSSTDLERYVLTPFLLVMIYSGLMSLLAETLGRFRHSVSGHPNRAFFRALDIPGTAVYLVYVLPRVAGPTLFWLLAGVGIGAGFTHSGAFREPEAAPVQAWVTLLAVPLALGLVTCTVGLFAASHPATLRPRLWAAAALTVPVGLVLGSTAAGWIVPVMRSGGTSAVTVPPSPLPSAALPALALLAGCLVVMVPLWSRLRRRSFPSETSHPTTYRFRAAGPPALLWARLISAQRVSGWRFRVEVRLAAALLGGIAAVGAARIVGLPSLTGSGLLPHGSADQIVFPMIAFTSLLFGVTIADLSLNDVGPHSYGRHLRNAVESGTAVATAVVAQAIALATPVAVLSGLLAALASLAVGQPVLSPLMLALGALAAAVIAETLFPPPRATDGTATESVFTGVATLILAALPAAVPLTFIAASPWFMPLGVAALLGGALVCLRQHIVRLS